MIVRILTAADARLLERVADEVFDEPVDPALAAEFLTTVMVSFRLQD
ncbi:MAG: hypothetical protein PHG43_12480 [Phenylobacterium sp.]|nr:hypothetical protein [Phenylobacterium sp.]